MESSPHSTNESQVPIHDIELPMCFYLGREYNLAKKKVLDQPIMYDAKDLTTHGVVVGMTGSGKTGLCISLLEEAAIDGIPSIIIDPKGDLTNLLLQFPDLSPKDFQKWLNPGEARQKKMTPEKYAEEIAERWQKGLDGSLQSKERIRLLMDSSEWRIYTPGSEAGLPLSILKTFTAPEGNVLREQLNQRIDATATALLGLTGTAADPVQSREHILIAQLFLHSWMRGIDLDLPELISQIQLPPINKIGAFDVETFYPEKDRLKLAISLNNILAAPSFSTWINGEALDLTNMLFTPEGKPRQVIFYIAHLDESQRLFFVTLLLEEVLNWTRKQPGTTTLRALLYFDEVFGYLPPHPGNPPTKLPLMTMLKQARAFGVGVLLATQNPVDLDYKALSNAGTWFVGKLQTERDKERLIEGLEGVAAEQGSLSNRQYLETVISSLGKRVFLLHNIHRGKPLLFQTRHALSFLRGPMTRDQVATLMKPVKEAMGVGTTTNPESSTHEVKKTVAHCSNCQEEMQEKWKYCPFCGNSIEVAASRLADEEFKVSLQAIKDHKPTPKEPAQEQQGPPEIPEDIPQFYLPLSSPARPAEADGPVYQAKILGVAEVHFSDRRLNIYHPQQYQLMAESPQSGEPFEGWHSSEKIKGSYSGLPNSEAIWNELPSIFESSRNLKNFEKELEDYLYRDARLTIFENKKLNLVGNPGEDVMDFQSRCMAASQKAAEEEIAEERRRYRPKFARLGGKVPEGNSPIAAQGTLMSGLFSLLSLGMGKKLPTNDRLARLESEWFAKQSAILEEWNRIGMDYEEVRIQPYKKNIKVIAVGLVWAPFWKLKSNSEMIAAY